MNVQCRVDNSLLQHKFKYYSPSGFLPSDFPIETLRISRGFLTHPALVGKSFQSVAHHLTHAIWGRRSGTPVLLRFQALGSGYEQWKPAGTSAARQRQYRTQCMNEHLEASRLLP
jgi:hypothetical protein